MTEEKRLALNSCIGNPVRHSLLSAQGFLELAISSTDRTERNKHLEVAHELIQRAIFFNSKDYVFAAKLDGDPLSLFVLTKIFCAGSNSPFRIRYAIPEINSDGENFFKIESNLLLFTTDEKPDYTRPVPKSLWNRAYRRLEEMVEIVNGCGRLAYLAHKPVHVDRIFCYNPRTGESLDWTEATHIQNYLSLFSVRPDDRYEHELDEIRAFSWASVKNPTVSDAIRNYGHGPVGWDSQFRAYDVIKNDITEKSIEQIMGAGRRRAFTGAANNSRYLSQNPRHGGGVSKDVGINPFQHGDEFIKELIRRWVRTKDGFA